MSIARKSYIRLFIRNTIIILSLAKHSNKRRLRFDGHGRSFDIHLEKSDAIPEKLKVISHDHNNAGDSYVFRDHQVENRYYHAKLKNEDNEPVVASGLMLDEGFKGGTCFEKGISLLLQKHEISTRFS